MCHSVSTFTLKGPVVVWWDSIHLGWIPFQPAGKCQDMSSHVSSVWENRSHVKPATRSLTILETNPGHLKGRTCFQSYANKIGSCIPKSITIQQDTSPGETVDSRFTSPAGTSNRIGRSLWSRHDLGEHRGHQVMQGNLSNLYQNNNWMSWYLAAYS